MKKAVKYSLITLGVLLLLVIANGTYWLLSNVQTECYQRVKKSNYSPEALNTYEKLSIYSIHLGICFGGWPASHEATIQEWWMTFPTSKEIIRTTKSFSDNYHILELQRKYPNASKNNPIRITWKPKTNEFGKFTAYDFKNMRCALAVNGTYMWKEDGHWIITGTLNHEFLYPDISGITYIGPFKFQEGLIRYLQIIDGWLYVPKYKWILK